MNLYSYLFAVRRHRCNKTDIEESMANINTYGLETNTKTKLKKGGEKTKADPSVPKRTSLG